MKDGYSFASENNGCVISKDNMFVACASIVNGLFVLNLDDSPICNISTKRSLPNDLSPTYIWHCRLGHISEKRMKKLHNDGLLTSFDFESYETCEACLLGKMTVVWTSLGPLPRWVPGPTTRWAPGTTRLALHGT
jgi:hypothetical protein